DRCTLGGPNSVAPFALNEMGKAQVWLKLPLQIRWEDFCGFGINLISVSTLYVPFVSQKGVMTPLPTLRGNNGDELGKASFDPLPFYTIELTSPRPRCIDLPELEVRFEPSRAARHPASCLQKFRLLRRSHYHRCR